MDEKKYLKYNIGLANVNSHIDAVHAQSPSSDQYTGEIVQNVIDKTNFSGIITTISREKMDINRIRSKKNAPAIDEYREVIKEIIISKGILNNNQLEKKYLHLAIHGMKNEYNKDFEIGTLKGNSCSNDIEKWFIEKLKKITDNFGVNSIFPGDQSKSVHRTGDTNYIGYGIMFNTIQIEINRDWRKTKQKELTIFFSEIMKEFDIAFN